MYANGVSTTAIATATATESVLLLTYLPALKACVFRIAMSDAMVGSGSNESLTHAGRLIMADTVCDLSASYLWSTGSSRNFW